MNPVAFAAFGGHFSCRKRTSAMQRRFPRYFKDSTADED
jgi:hypothetical protein